jgi:hypothetical protein
MTAMVMEFTGEYCLPVAITKSRASRLVAGIIHCMRTWSFACPNPQQIDVTNVGNIFFAEPVAMFANPRVVLRVTRFPPRRSFS